MGQRHEKERANLITIAIANLGVAYAQSQGAKNAAPEWFNPWQYQFEVEDAQETIGVPTARVIKELVSLHKIPSWAVQQLNMKVIDRALAGEDPLG